VGVENKIKILIEGCKNLGIHHTIVPQNTGGHTHSCNVVKWYEMTQMTSVKGKSKVYQVSSHITKIINRDFFIIMTI
jgi:hypothetical protein